MLSSEPPQVSNAREFTTPSRAISAGHACPFKRPESIHRTPIHLKGGEQLQPNFRKGPEGVVCERPEWIGGKF